VVLASEVELKKRVDRLMKLSRWLKMKEEEGKKRKGQGERVSGGGGEESKEQ